MGTADAGASTRAASENPEFCPAEGERGWKA